MSCTGGSTGGHQHKSYWIRARDFERSFYDGTCIDCVRFVRRDVFLDVGGFDTLLTGPEDWDLDRRIKESGRVGSVGQPLYHDEGGSTLREYLDKMSEYDGSFDAYIRKWGRGDILVRRQLGPWYRMFRVFVEHGKWRKLLVHPGAALGMYMLRLAVGARYLARKRGTRPSQDGKGVLVLSPFFSPNIGGVETHLDDLCDCLDRHGYRVYVETYVPLTNKAGNVLKHEKRGNVRITRHWWFGQGWFHKVEKFPVLDFVYVSTGLFYYSLLFMLRHHDEIDVIHSQGLNASFIGGVLALFFRKRHVTSFHTLYRFSERRLLAPCVRAVLRSSDRVLVLGGSGKDDLERIGVSESKVETYRYWLKDEFFSPLNMLEARRITGLPEGRIVALFVGRFVDSKAPQYLFDAVSATRNRDLLFVFIGTGPNERHVRALSAGRDDVIFLGKMDNEALPAYYAAADFLLLGPVDIDIPGRVSMEALSCGLPVVLPTEATFFGIRKKVKKGVLGDGTCFFASTDSEGRRRLYGSLGDNRAQLARARKTCMDYAASSFSASNAETIMDSYRLMQ